MPHALSPKRILGILFAVAVLAFVVAQVAMAAVTMNPLTDGNDVARTSFKPGDVIKASGSVDNNKWWRFVRINGTTVTPVTTCVQASGVTPVNTTYTVQATDAEGPWTFELRQANNSGGCNGTMYDAASRAYTVDKTVPTVSSVNRAGASPTNQSSVSWTVTFSESVTGVNAADFALDATGLSGSSITNVTGSGTTWTVTADTGSNEGTLGLNLVDDDTVVDPAGNALGGGLTGQVYTIDRSAPTVSSIDRAGSSPTNASSVSWTVTFSDSVTGVDAADFALSASGLTGTSITGVTGSGATWTVTANTGSGAGTLGLNLVDDDTIADTAGNGLTGGFTGQAYSVDRAAPTVDSIDRADASPTKAGSVSWTVTFSETVTGVSATDFALAASGLTGTSITGVTGTGATRTVTADTGTGSGTLGLNLVDDDTINDSVGNGLAGGFSGQAYTVDRTAPTVQSINRANVSPTNAGSVTWTVSFSESVTGVDATDFTLAATGLTGASVTNVTGSGSTRTVTASTGSGTGTLGLDLADDDTIRDSVDNALAGGLTGQVYSVDTDAPAVDSIDRADASPTNAGSVTWTVTFSEDVTGVDATDFALAAAGVTGASITNVTGTGDTRTVTVDTGTGSGTLGLNLSDDDTILDGLGNKLGGTGTTGAGDGGFTGQAYTLDRTAPTADSITRADASPTNDGTVSWTVTFSESVTGVNADDFTLDATGLTGTSITNVTGSGTSYTVTADTGTGDGTLGLDLVDDDSIADGVGNPLAGGLAGQSYALDRTAPTVDSIARTGATPTDDGSVSWTVTFSEAVTGVTDADFALAATGVTGASITNVSGSGATRTVTADTGTGSGTLGLNLVDDDTIVDTAGNGLAAGATGETYAIDKADPTVTSIDRAAATPTTAGTVSWTVTFSESVTGVDATDFALAASGLTGTSITGVTGTGATRTVTADTGTGSGTLGLNLSDDDSIIDAAGNELAGGLTGQVYTLDRTGPTVDSINRADASPTNDTSVSWTVTFSETVTGVSDADFALAATGVTGASIINVTGTGATRTVIVDTGTGTGTLGLNLVDDDTITDSLGNALGSGFTGQVYSVDRTAPTASSVARADASPTNDATVSWTVTFSESVTGVTAADFNLAPTGVTGAAITGVTGSGTTWTVSSSTGSGSGTLGLNLADDDTIADAAGNTLASGLTGEAYEIDLTSPTVDSIDRASASPSNAGSASWTVTFSEAVSGVSADDFALAATGVTGAAITGVTGTGATRTVTANTGDGSGTLGLNLVDDDSIIDNEGNDLAGGFTGQTYALDKAAPISTSINRTGATPTGAGSVAWTVTFSEAVTGVNAADFALAASGVTGASITGVTGTGATRTVTASTGSGNGTLGLNLVDDDTIVDSVGNTLAGGRTGQVYAIDKTVPAPAQQQPSSTPAATPPSGGFSEPSKADVRAPLGTLSSKVSLRLADLLRKGVNVGLVADENAAATLQLTLQRGGKRIVLGTAKATLKAGTRSKVALKLTKKGKAQLSKVRGTARLSLRVTLRDSAGNATALKARTLTVKR